MYCGIYAVLSFQFYISINRISNYKKQQKHLMLFQFNKPQTGTNSFLFI